MTLTTTYRRTRLDLDGDKGQEILPIPPLSVLGAN